MNNKTTTIQNIDEFKTITKNQLQNHINNTENPHNLNIYLNIIILLDDYHNLLNLYMEFINKNNNTYNPENINQFLHEYLSTMII
jgi:hypothetical protein